MSSSDSSPGTYLLLLACERVVRLPIGRLGVMTTRPGYYLYVGSAFGPGGIRARIGHHAKTAAHPHWHLDYLRTQADLVDAWCVFDAHHEHEWARLLMKDKDSALALKGFGSSDCGCLAHLFYLERKPGIEKLETLFACDLTRVELAGGE
jgi:Uri superfamily endonuclease